MTNLKAPASPAKDLGNREDHGKAHWHSPTVREVGVLVGTDGKIFAPTENSEVAVVGPS